MMKVGRLKGTVALLIAAVPFAGTPASAVPEIEEVVVQARLQNAAEQLVNERMDDEVVTDLIGAEMIGRIGDATVAAALRRVSGLTLVNDKFVYVRGLGERYSSSTLNGATIPSPDLTRNVIPLDIFPTAIVQSLAVQKSYSADQGASFGGGNIDIRTKGIPDAFTYSLEFGSGFNTEVDGDILTYAGGGDDDWGQDDGTRALSASILQSVERFVGQIDAQGILSGLRKEGNSSATIADAQALNRQIALGLNRNISIENGSDDPDLSLKGNIGNNFYLGDKLEIGFLLGAGYSSKWRKTETFAANFSFPDERFERESETTRSIDVNTNLNLGVRYTEDHMIASTTLYIRNTDDEVAVIDYFNENREKSDGLGWRTDRIKFEERAMVVNQVRGEHTIGYATREELSFLPLAWVPEDLQINWQYSDARASTEIPNEVDVSLETVTDVTTAEVMSSSVVLSNSAANYRFTELDDDVIDYDFEVIWPIMTSRSVIEISGGAGHSQKARSYRQAQFSLGPLNVADSSTLSGPLGSVFSDSNITDSANDYAFDLFGTNNQSYLAATMVDSAFGKIDWTWNDTWRVAAGARWESYRQVALDWNIFGYTLTSPQISTDPAVLQNASFHDDKVYPSVALTYIDDLWAEVFQLRFGWSETVVRPDLREITDASYIDARTGFLTDGNPGVIPAELSNFDVRAEWFFTSGDNLTVSLFYKDISNPIEFFESAASDTNRAREIVNAESGEVMGVEIEGLKSLDFLDGWLGDWGSAFFVQGNATFQDSELVAGAQADAPTNNIRQLAGASDYVLNVMVGFDSLDAKHAATIVYNVFGERLYTAGRRGAPDAFEEPFNSLDLTYSWYPTDAITVKAKAQNLLDDEISISREGVEVFREKPGTSLALSIKWEI